MKTVQKSDFSHHAVKVPSIAGKKLKIDMLVFRNKYIDTLEEEFICGIIFKNKNGTEIQAEDIVIKNTLDVGIEKYDARLKSIVVAQGGEKVTCIKDLKQFIKKSPNDIPTRWFYKKGYGWTRDNDSVRFDGSIIVGQDVVLSESNHHLIHSGNVQVITDLCNNIMQNKDKVQFLLAVSLAAPIFGALDMKSLFVNVSGFSSIGKTTILNLCMSFWSRQEDKNICTTWYDTENCICSRLNDIHGVPFLIDDTSKGRIENPIDIIYNLEDGKSKGRLNKSFEISSDRTWSTCIYSSSETSLLKCVKKDTNGAYRRLVEIDVIQGDLISNQEQVRVINDTICKNYGDVGIQFVQKLFELKFVNNDFKKLRIAVRKKQEILQKMVALDGISKGLTEKLALVLYAAELGKQYLGLDFNIELLTRYVKLIIENVSKVSQSITVEKVSLATAYQKVCNVAEHQLGENYHDKSSYYIPVKEIFNGLEKELGYQFKELRKLFAEHSICKFPHANGDTGLENSKRIENPATGKKEPVKVITVAKNIHFKI